MYGVLCEVDEAMEMLSIALFLTLGLLLRTRCFRTSGGSLSEIGQVKMTRINAFYSPLKLKKKSFGEMRWMEGNENRSSAKRLARIDDFLIFKRTEESDRGLLTSDNYFP